MGFSLTPHLRVGGGDGEISGTATEQAAPKEDTNGGACFPPPLRSDHYWRYDSELNESNPNGEVPKFEDFLGNCYSNSPQNEAGEINMNMPPNFDDQKREDFNNPSLFYPPYQYAAVANPDAAYFGGCGGAAASGFKSWLQQPDKPAAEGGGHCDLQALSLTLVSPLRELDSSFELLKLGIAHLYKGP